VKVRRRSPFHRIIVHDRAGLRTLHFGDTIQSTMRIDDPHDGGLEYVDFFHLAILQRDAVDRVLFIGLGGGTGPKQFARCYPEMELDVVEIDPEVIRVAKELFGFEVSARCRVHENDGLSFLEESTERWDAIIVDAYTTEGADLAIPLELTDEEFFELCASRLTREGMVVFNCAASSEDQIVKELHEAMGGVFAAQLTFESTGGDNTILVASAAPFEQRAARLIERLRGHGSGVLAERPALVRRCRQIKRRLSKNPR
jgi:spermidine synthase